MNAGEFGHDTNNKTVHFTVQGYVTSIPFLSIKINKIFSPESGITLLKTNLQHDVLPFGT